MIVRTDFKKSISKYVKNGEDISYYGKDALLVSDEEVAKRIKEYLYCDCITHTGDKGIIIGVEESNSFLDYYYIVFIPSKNKVMHELVNDPSFSKTIKV